MKSDPLGVAPESVATGKESVSEHAPVPVKEVNTNKESRPDFQDRPAVLLPPVQGQERSAAPRVAVKEAKTSKECRPEYQERPAVLILPPVQGQLDLKGNEIAKVGPSRMDPTLLVTMLPKGGNKMELIDSGETALGSVACSDVSSLLISNKSTKVPKSAKMKTSSACKEATKTSSSPKMTPNEEKMSGKEGGTRKKIKSAEPVVREPKKNRTANRQQTKERIKSPSPTENEIPPPRKASKTCRDNSATKLTRKQTKDGSTSAIPRGGSDTKPKPKSKELPPTGKDKSCRKLVHRGSEGKMIIKVAIKTATAGTHTKTSHHEKATVGGKCKTNTKPRSADKNKKIKGKG